MDQAGPSRRAVLAAAGLLAIAGCSARNEPQPPEPDPDLPIKALAIDGVRRLVRLYDAASRAHPSLRAELAPLAAETMAHLSALDPPAAGATPSASASTTPAPTVTAPASATEARASLARAERHEADLRVAQLLRASSGLARLLAAIGASEATHATLLGAGR